MHQLNNLMQHVSSLPCPTHRIGAEQFQELLLSGATLRVTAVTIPTADHGYCVLSFTRTLVSVEGQPSHSSMGSRAEALADCNSDRLLLSGLFDNDAAMAPLPVSFALFGRARLQQANQQAVSS